MLEILLVFLIGNANSKLAKTKGRNGGAYLGLTFGLWFGFEIIGGLIGYAVLREGIGIYGFALGGAVIGGIASFIITSSVSPLAQPAGVPQPGGIPQSIPAKYSGIVRRAAKYLDANGLIVKGTLEASFDKLTFIGKGNISSIELPYQAITDARPLNRAEIPRENPALMKMTGANGVLLEVKYMADGGERTVYFSGGTELANIINFKVRPLMQPSLQQVKKFCTKCGNKIEDPAERCPFCGADLVPKTDIVTDAVPQQVKKFCTKCGNKIEDPAERCPSCGADFAPVPGDNKG